MNKSGSAGTLTDTYHQDAYGNVLSNVNTGQWASASSFSDRHLTTKEYDNEAYLYYFGKRWYDPGVGRFISRDPVFAQLLPYLAGHSVQSLLLSDMLRRQYMNQYVYALNNPLNYVDPSGGCSMIPPKTRARLEELWKAIKRACWEMFQRACNIAVPVPDPEDPTGFVEGLIAYLRHCMQLREYFDNPKPLPITPAVEPEE